MRSVAALAVGMAALLVAVAVLIGVLTLRASIAGEAETPTMTTFAGARITVQADRARLAFELSRDAADREASLEAINRNVNELQRPAEAAGLDRDAISVEGLHTYRSGNRWRSEATVIMVVDDLSLLPDLLRATKDASFRDLTGPMFELSDDSERVERAMDEAMATARAKADAAATRAGMKVTGVASISEESTRTRPERPWSESQERSRLESFSGEVSVGGSDAPRTAVGLASAGRTFIVSTTVTADFTLR